MSILNFVPLNFFDAQILLVESSELLSGLRKILPAAQIAFLAKEISPETKKICDEFRADLIDELPTAPKIFEMIIAPEVLTSGENFYATLMAFNHLLKDSGFLLTQFYNVRFLKVLQRDTLPARRTRNN